MAGMKVWENHRIRMVGMGRNCWGSSCPTPAQAEPPRASCFGLCPGIPAGLPGYDCNHKGSYKAQLGSSGPVSKSLCSSGFFPPPGLDSIENQTDCAELVPSAPNLDSSFILPCKTAELCDKRVNLCLCFSSPLSSLTAGLKGKMRADPSVSAAFSTSALLGGLLGTSPSAVLPNSKRAADRPLLLRSSQAAWGSNIGPWCH